MKFNLQNEPLFVWLCFPTCAFIFKQLQSINQCISNYVTAYLYNVGRAQEIKHNHYIYFPVQWILQTYM